jgi:hypothetical protein
MGRLSFEARPPAASLSSLSAEAGKLLTMPVATFYSKKMTR